MPHTITNDFVDGFRLSAFNRDLPWKCHTQSPMTLRTDYVHRHFTQSPTTLQTDYRPSAFIGSSQLLTNSPTDGANSKGRVLNASLTACSCRRNYRQIFEIWRVIKNSGVKFKIYQWIFETLPTE